jgi:Zn finger protein HypA/HybF involved in hydrogenase expression
MAEGLSFRIPKPKMRVCLGLDCTVEFRSMTGEHFCPKCRAKNEAVLPHRTYRSSLRIR